MVVGKKMVGVQIKMVVGRAGPARKKPDPTQPRKNTTCHEHKLLGLGRMLWKSTTKHTLFSKIRLRHVDDPWA